MVITVSNWKGGCGKTTTVIAFTENFKKDKKILLVDTDPQANLTSFYVQNYNDIKKRNLLEFINNKSKKNIINVSDNVDILPSISTLAEYEVEMYRIPGSDLLLAEALKTVSGYDYILIDTPPALGLYTRNALFCSDVLIMPCEPDLWSIEGCRKLINLVKKLEGSPLAQMIRIQKYFILPVKIENSYFSTFKKKLINEMKDIFDIPILPSVGNYDIAIKKSNYRGILDDRKILQDYYKSIKGVI